MAVWQTQKAIGVRLRVTKKTTQELTKEGCVEEGTRDQKKRQLKVPQFLSHLILPKSKQV